MTAAAVSLYVEASLQHCWLISISVYHGYKLASSDHGAGKGDKVVPSKYDLIGNVVHDGKPGAGGTYRLHVHRKSEDAWYEVQDLRVTDILPQMVALSETYMQVYELKAQT